MSQAPICVVGMHRSGTSLTTRELSMLGVSLGDPKSLIPADAVDNPEGYQEPEATALELARFALGHDPDPDRLAVAAALPHHD